jgi:FixJ family two-component response regulator
MSYFEQATSSGLGSPLILRRSAAARFTIFIVEDDRGVLRALSRLLQAAGYKTKAYSSPQTFLDQHDPLMPGCVVLDLTMPALSGLDVQRALADRGVDRPVIFLSGAWAAPSVVKAMKAGAVDFLSKPVDQTALLNAIKAAKKLDSVRLRTVAEREVVKKLIDTLTVRQREVMALVVQGMANKDIAAQLGTTEKTVKVHRGRMVKKMGVRSVAELVRLTMKADIAITMQDVRT